MTPTAPGIIRWTGLSAMAAGTIFAGIQPIHPPDFLPSVTTEAWAVICSLKLAMCFLFFGRHCGAIRPASGKSRMAWSGRLYPVQQLLGAAVGLRLRGSLYLAAPGDRGPQFVDSYLGIVNGSPRRMNIGAAVPAYAVVGILYLLGGLLFGIGTFRSGILSRWPAGLLAVTSLVTPAAALLPHATQRLVAIPMGVAMAWLGYALWSERRESAVE
jgi:hypothetical protein